MSRSKLLAAAAALVVSATLSVSSAQAHYAAKAPGGDGTTHVKVSDGVFMQTANTATSLSECSADKSIVVTHTNITGADEGGNPIYGGSDSFQVQEGATFQAYTLRDGVPAKLGLARLVSVSLKNDSCVANIIMPAQ